MVIVIDFDGTCVANEFPKVGKEIGAADVLKALIKSGHQLVLFTMRSDMNDIATEEATGIQDFSKQYLQHALQWFKTNEIPLHGVQTNPTQNRWTKSPKAYGHIYIDDSALGCPLLYPANGAKPFVDWFKVAADLWARGLINYGDIEGSVIFQNR